MNFDLVFIRIFEEKTWNVLILIGIFCHSKPFLKQNFTPFKHYGHLKLGQLCCVIFIFRIFLTGYKKHRLVSYLLA